MRHEAMGMGLATAAVLGAEVASLEAETATVRTAEAAVGGQSTSPRVDVDEAHTDRHGQHARIVRGEVMRASAARTCEGAHGGAAHSPCSCRAQA